MVSHFKQSRNNQLENRDYTLANLLKRFELSFHSFQRKISKSLSDVPSYKPHDFKIDKFCGLFSLVVLRNLILLLSFVCLHVF